MTATMDRTQLIAELRQTIEELCEPDLHLARASELRSGVVRLLKELREADESSEIHPRISDRHESRFALAK